MKPKDGKKYRKKEKPAPRWSNAPKEKSPTEVTIEKDDPNVDLNEWYSVLILHVGSHLIEVTSTSDESRAATWITETLQEQRRLRRRGGPQVVSLCAFKGVSYSKRSWSINIKGPTGHPNHPSNPYLAISICLGGSHVLLYRHHGYDGNSFSIKPLEHLVDDKKVVVVGMPIKDIAKKLQDQCGLRVCV